MCTVLLAACGFSQHGSGAVDASVDAFVEPEGLPLDGPRTDWWDSRWHTRHAITIDASKLSGPVADFPVLVRLTQTTVDYAKTENGASLRFVASDHVTIVPFEMDTFAAGGTSFLWIKVSLDPAASPKTVYMYYDNPGVTSASNGPSVFGGFVSTHHLGPTAGFMDASGHNHTATSQNGGSTPANTAANIGRVSDFDGNDYLELPTEGDFDFTTAVSASAWIRINGFDTDYQAFVAKGDSAWRFQRAGTTRFAEFGTNSNPPDNLDGTKTVDDNTFHHIAVTYNGTTKRLYVDGALDGMMTAGAIANTSYTVRFGQNQESGDQSFPGGFRSFQGQLDEVRISNVDRNAAWFGAEYITVTDPMFAKVGQPEAY